MFFVVQSENVCITIYGKYGSNMFKKKREHVGFYVLCMIYLMEIFCFVNRTLSIFFTLVSSALLTGYNC